MVIAAAKALNDGGSSLDIEVGRQFLKQLHEEGAATVKFALESNGLTKDHLQRWHDMYDPPPTA